MLRSRLVFVGSCLASLVTLSQCATPESGMPGTAGRGGSSSGGASGAGNTAGTGNAGAAGGGGNTSGSAGTTGGSGNTTGVAGAAGAGNTTGAAGRGGTTGTAGAAGSGNTTGAAGAAGAAGRGGTTGNAGRGGSTGAAGAAGTTGTAGGGGTGGAAGAGVRTDMAGVPLAKPGDSTNVSRQYLNLGEMRLINNRWGSDEQNCTATTQRVFINSDRTIGWEFNRPNCGLGGMKPDYPEVEFGVAPFGANSTLLTTPAFSTTTLLPKQIKDITSAAVTIDTMTISLQRVASWNINFEVWFSQRNPVTDPNPGVFAEIMGFFGWETGRWPCDQTGSLTGYTLCHQSDTWANGQWRYYQFNINNGPLTTYNGRVDVKAFIDWIVNRYSLSRDLWLTRIEVGSEIGDAQGSVKIRNLTFEINGASRSPEFAP